MTQQLVMDFIADHAQFVTWSAIVVTLLLGLIVDRWYEIRQARIDRFESRQTELRNRAIREAADRAEENRNAPWQG